MNWRAGESLSQCAQDFPVCTNQAQLNEALITMYSGYHLDAYWDPSKYLNCEVSWNGNAPVGERW